MSEVMQPTPAELWAFLPWGFLVTIAIETPVLYWGLSSRHSRRARIGYGIGLTACTYPVVVLVLPLWMAGRWRSEYLWVAETFAPVAECLLFWAVERTGASAPTADGPQSGAAIPLRDWSRDLLAIVVANLLSFAAGWALS